MKHVQNIGGKTSCLD